MQRDSFESRCKITALCSYKVEEGEKTAIFMKFSLPEDGSLKSNRASTNQRHTC